MRAKAWTVTAGFLAVKENDALMARAFGLVLSVALVAGWVGLKLMHPKIGA